MYVELRSSFAFGGEANWTTPTSSNELLRCDAPGCHLTVSVLSGFGGLYFTDYEPQYHLSCQGLFDKPVGGWFCDDDECKKNAGYQVGGGRKHRRRG